MKYLTLLMVSLVYIALFPSSLSADVVNPEYYTKKCPTGKIEVICRYTSKEPFGPHTTDSCIYYRQDNNYEYLTGRGSSFGGNSKYCVDPEYHRLNSLTQSTQGIISNPNLNTILIGIKALTSTLILTILIEAFVFIFLGFRSLRSFGLLLGVNILTVFLLSFFLNLTSTIQLWLIIIGELAVIFTEVILLRNVIKERTKQEVTAAIIIANLASAIFGSGFMYFISLF